MDWLRPIAEGILSLYNPISQEIGYLKDLDRNIETLIDETEDLDCMCDEIRADVEAAVLVCKKRKKRQVENWFVRVRKKVIEVVSIKSELQQERRGWADFCTYHFSRYRLGKKVVKMIKDVEELKEKGDFDKVAESPHRPTVEEMQAPTQHSTSKQALEEIIQCLHDEDKGIIFVYGMGGIGKTTLMQAINNRFIGTNDFNVVIWATVSKDLNLGVIHEKIGKKLHMKLDNNEDMEDKRDRLFARLKNVRYMLILDKLWQAFSLDQVGIPKLEKQNRF